jgi:ribosomal protein L37AE/L43A
MQPADTRHAMEEVPAQQEEARKKAACRFCGSDRVYRLYREGFLQMRFYPLLGLYPWRCKACSASMMLRKRKQAKRVVPTA